MKHHDYTLPAKVSEALYDFAQECRMLDGQAFTMCAVANRLDGIRAILSEYMNRDNEVDDGEEEND